MFPRGGHQPDTSTPLTASFNNAVLKTRDTAADDDGGGELGVSGGGSGDGGLTEEGVMESIVEGLTED